MVGCCKAFELSCWGCRNENVSFLFRSLPISEVECACGRERVDGFGAEKPWHTDA